MVLYFRFVFTIQTINVTVEQNFACYCVVCGTTVKKVLRSKSQTLDSSVCQDSRNLTGAEQPLVCSKYHAFLGIAEPYDKYFYKCNTVTVCHFYCTDSCNVEFGVVVVIYFCNVQVCVV